MITREKLVEIMEGSTWADVGVAADRILAAIAKEQEGEVVIAEGHIKRCFDLFFFSLTHFMGEIKGKGRLIFRPTKAKETGL